MLNDPDIDALNGMKSWPVSPLSRAYTRYTLSTNPSMLTLFAAHSVSRGTIQGGNTKHKKRGATLDCKI